MKEKVGIPPSPAMRDYGGQVESVDRFSESIIAVSFNKRAIPDCVIICYNIQIHYVKY